MPTLTLARAGAATLLLGLAACATETLPTAALPGAPADGASVAIHVAPVSQRVTVDDPSPTVSALWDRVAQDAIARKSPGPTITARAFAILHSVLYETWAAIDPVASGAALGDTIERPAAWNTDAAKHEAMSYAAFAVLSEMFPEDADRFEAVMDALGYDTGPQPLSGTVVGLGFVMAANATARWRRDGSNWDDDFEDPSGYVPANPGPRAVHDLGRWTPENTPIDPEYAEPDQEFYTPHWGTLRAFALPRGDALRPPPPEPVFSSGLRGRIDVETAEVVLADGQRLPVTPDLVGPVISPRFIAQAEEVVAFSAALTDRQKLIAEFWEDATDTAFPPGTWMAFAQYVSARDDHSIDDDARLFFVMANAMQDAAIATWEAKRHYDYARPVRVIRGLGRLGLIGRPGVDELTGEQGHVIRAWGGPGLGTRTILAARFLSYQTPTLDPSPPFAEYPSGHSSFSAAGAEVLATFTGSDRFGAAVSFAPGSSRFEPGTVPAAEVVLAWPTFSAAADEAGISRRYGGIHFVDADLRARVLGRQVARLVIAKAEGYLHAPFRRGAGGS
ncbi:vanadium-dependent haloperoxidase [Paralimibaculum aggregatum]|uniref:Vanadium-dependent haloperoxidase n=1 Tax=Paralimibaculum aggregatum TaxID=3036245 RepID=A0ABQ6LL34_9RHOB|nr:vanadium-dependent haloperoxidase [Limibaculum sp. NKW23]GMG83942.1 vanadium-dependent haloperoxidase [Limibaculum sp. NKW23]